MVRSVALAAVGLGLAWSSFAVAQSSSPPQAAPAPERYITVREEGKPPQRCQVLRSWQQPDGAPAFQVRAVDTGEVMTIVGSGPSAEGGDRRAMLTRIFRWGSSNKPPAGAPLPPSTAGAMATPPAQPIPSRGTPVIPPQATQSENGQSPMAVQPPKATPVVTPQAIPSAPPPSAIVQAIPTPRPTPATLTALKPDVAPSPAVASPTPAQPTTPPPTVTTSKPTTSTSVVPSNPGGGTLPSLTPMSTQVIQQRLVPTPVTRECTPGTPPEPRLVPSASGTVVSQTPGNCGCSTSCNACCQPCNPCGQPSCVCCTPSPMRQSFLRRLFKSNPSGNCTEAVCQTAPDSAPAPAPNPAGATPPAPAVPKVAAEPAKPGDWRESWGKVEPWKDTAKATPVQPAETVSQRVEPKPVQLETPKEPDPLKNPDLYRDMAMNARLSNSKIPEESQPEAASRPKSRLFASMRSPEPKPPLPPPQQPAEAASAETAANVVSPLRAPGRVVQLPANEGNAFWSPPEPPAQRKEQEQEPKSNAFDRDENSPPQQGVSPGIASGYAGRQGVSPRIAPGYAGPLPPPGPMQRMQQPMPSRPDVGVPDAMGNAFTLPGTRRPIPADFGGTPQEPNGFDPNVQMGQGSPPQGYGMSMPRPPMPNMVAMGPRMPIGANPLMSVPATPVAHGGPMADARPAGVPQLLAKLQDSLYPSERESAAEQLSQLNWRVQPQVVASLMKSARGDPAPTVRAACVHALAQMKVDTAGAVALVRDLKSDRDPRVRQEAEEALSALGDSGIQQASHK
jgi:hypothetical protein